MAGALPEGCGGLTLITDPADKCVHYERGDCIPHFNTDFTSIVTEVSLFEKKFEGKIIRAKSCLVDLYMREKETRQGKCTHTKRNSELQKNIELP